MTSAGPPNMPSGSVVVQRAWEGGGELIWPRCGARENDDIKGIVFDSFVECQGVVARNDLGKVWCADASMTDARIA
jgi:hypothetical protein